MKKLLTLVLLFLVGLMVLTVLFFKLFGWPGLGLMFVLIVLGGMYLKSIAGKLLQKAFVTPFLMKGAVLKDATAQVHSVQPAARPARTFVQEYNEADDDTDDEDDEDFDEDEDEDVEIYNRHFTIDVTITPQPSDGGGFQHWEPGEMTLVKPDTRSGDIANDDAEVGSVLETQIWQDNAWVDDDGMKFHGPQRLKLLVGVKDGVRTCRFQYYFQVFGQVELNDTVPTSAEAGAI